MNAVMPMAFVNFISPPAVLNLTLAAGTLAAYLNFNNKV
jgi:hypothetical protein